MTAETLDAVTALSRLGVAHAGWAERLGRLPGARVVLPAVDDALFERLGLTEKDANVLRDGWPSPAWPAELRRLLERVAAHLRRDLGGYGLVEPGPPLARDGSPPRHYFAVYALLGLLEDVRRYHGARGVPDEITWATLADLLDLNINTAVQWTQHASRDWSHYLQARIDAIHGTGTRTERAAR